MTSQEFWLSVLSNFLATLVAGSAIGGFITWFLTRQENSNARKRIALERDLEIEEKKERYLKIIKSEIIEVTVQIETFLDNSNRNRTDVYIYLFSDYWEILKSGGEIPILFEPVLIQLLSVFYSKVNEVNALDYRRFIVHQSITAMGEEGTYLSKIKDKMQSIIDKYTYKSLMDVIQEVQSKNTKRIGELKKSINK